MATIPITDTSTQALSELFDNTTFQVKEEAKTSKNDSKTIEKTQEKSIETILQEETPNQTTKLYEKAKEKEKRGRKKGTKNGEGEKLKNGVYCINFDIDKPLEDYFKETQWITRKTKKEYLNDLIRKDMIERIGAKKNCSDEELSQKWLEYKKKLQSIYEEL